MKKNKVETLDLFSDKVCSHCNQNPGYNPRNPLLWNGFYDKDTGELVCNDCRDLHYKKKFESEHAAKWSEYPVYARGYNFYIK